MKINKQVIFHSLRIIISLIFITSGLLKFTALSNFQEAIYKLALINDNFVPLISIIIPFLETLVGFSLLINFKTVFFSQVLISLILFFTAVLSITISEGSNSKCGCFGNLMNDEINLFTILRNIFLLILTYILFSLSINNNKVNYKSKIKIHILIALFFFLVIQNVAFSIRNIELKKRIYKFIGEEILSKGEIVNPVKANTINGDLRYIDFTKYNKSLIFIMQFGCEPCRSNQKYWRQLYSHFGSEINIIGFCINNSELTKNLIKKDSLDYIVYSVPDEEFKINFKVYSTPQTILIDDKGIVKDIWKGRLNITILNQITNNLN